MLVNEVYRLLDRQCSLSFTNDYQIFEISKKFGIRAPSIVLFDHDKIEVLFYIQRGAEKYREVKIFLDSLDAKDVYGNWVVSSKTDKYDELSLIQELSRIPSFSIDGIYLDQGDLHLHFRFHSNFNKPLSTVLGHYVSIFPNFHIQRLGPSPGLFQILKNATTYVSLSQISTINVHETGPMEENPLGTDWIREGDILPQLTRVASRFSDRSYHCWQSSNLHGRNFGSAPPYSVQSGIPDIYCGIQVPIDDQAA